RVGNIDTRHPFGAAKEGLRAGVVESGSIDVDVVIVKPERQWGSGDGPEAVWAFGQGKALAGANDHRLRIGRIDSESGLAFEVHFRIVVAGCVERRGAGVGGG